MISIPGGFVLPGDFAAVKTHGDVSRAISFGEKLSGGTGRWEHAIFYAGGPHDLILEAEPGGAKLHGFDHYRNRPQDLLWSTTNHKLDLTSAQRALAMPLAEQYEGTPYSFLDYLAIAGHRAHVPGWMPFWQGQGQHDGIVSIKTYIAETGHEICSALVDLLRKLMGSHLFKDVWEGYVTPDMIGDVIIGRA